MFSSEWGRKPIKEKFNTDQKSELPLYLRTSPYSNIKSVEMTPFKGASVINNDKVMRNMSDFTQRERGDKE